MVSERTLKHVAASDGKRESKKLTALPFLQVSKNGSLVQEVPLDLPRLLIGRSEDNDITITSRYVSRHHILLVAYGGSTILVDLNSTNGTFVNSKRVYNHVLANEDMISVDRHSPFVQYSIRFCDPGAATRAVSRDLGPADLVIEKALADIGDALEKSDTDLLPALSENVPTEIGFVDDR